MGADDTHRDGYQRVGVVKRQKVGIEHKTGLVIGNSQEIRFASTYSEDFIFSIKFARVTHIYLNSERKFLTSDFLLNIQIIK